jgi:hypothetical protein
MPNRHATGVSPSGSGYSAEPEPSCTVSAVPVSIPNARRVWFGLAQIEAAWRRGDFGYLPKKGE